MKNKEFDEGLKNKLESFHSEVNVGDLWSAIESDVEAINKNENKQRKFVWLFSFLLGLAVLSVGLLVWGNMEEETALEENFSLGSNKMEAPSSLIQVGENKTQELFTSKNTNQIESAEEEGRENSNLLFGNARQSAEPNNLSVEQSNNTFTKKYNQFTGDSHLSVDQAGNTFIKNKESLKTKTIISDSSVDNSQSRFSSPKLPSNLLTPKGDNTSTFFPLENEKPKEAKKINADVFSNQKKIIPNVSLLDETLNAQILEVASLNLWSDSSGINDLPKYYKRPEKYQFSIGVQGGVSLIQRDLSSSHTEAADYLSLRESTEQPLEAVHLGIQGSVLHQSGFEISLGLQMTQLNEAFETSGTRIEFDTIPDGLYGFYINPNGNTLPVYDQIINSKEISFAKKTINRYRMLDIPVLLGYHFQKEKWSLGVQAGIVANLRLKTKGDMLDESENILDLGAEQNTIFRSNIGLSYYLGGSGRIFITRHLQVSINPFLRVFPKSFTQSDFSLKQKYQLIGGSVGVSYQF